MCALLPNDVSGMRKPTKMDHDQTVIEMSRLGHTLQEIGDALGVSRERVRQRNVRLRRQGRVECKPVEARKAQYITAAETADLLYDVAQYVPAFLTPPVLIGEKLYYLRAEVVALAEKRQKEWPRCKRCGAKLHQTNATYCMKPECRQTANQARRQRRLSDPPLPTKGIQGRIARELVRNSDCKIGFVDAIRLSGLTHMQLLYARQCGTVTIKAREPGEYVETGLYVRVWYSEVEMRQIGEMVRDDP